MKKGQVCILWLPLFFLLGMVAECYWEYRESLPKKPAVIQKQWTPRKDTFKGLYRV